MSVREIQPFTLTLRSELPLPLLVATPFKPHTCQVSHLLILHTYCWTPPNLPHPMPGGLSRLLNIWTPASAFSKPTQTSHLPQAKMAKFFACTRRGRGQIWCGEVRFWLAQGKSYSLPDFPTLLTFVYESQLTTALTIHHVNIFMYIYGMRTVRTHIQYIPWYTCSSPPCLGNCHRPKVHVIKH